MTHVYAEKKIWNWNSKRCNRKVTEDETRTEIPKIEGGEEKLDKCKTKLVLTLELNDVLKEN